MNDKIYSQMAEKIIEQQETVIGPVAVEQAKQVPFLKIDWQQHQVGITSSPTKVIDDLVQRYKLLFGQIAVETCKEAVASVLAQLPKEKQPKSLQ